MLCNIVTRFSKSRALLICLYVYTTNNSHREHAQRKYNVERVRELRARVAKSRDREEIAQIRDELDVRWRTVC